MEKQVKISATVVSNNGMISELNRDNFYLNRRYIFDYERSSSIEVSVENVENTHVFAVCDGKGEGKLGEAASFLAVNELKKLEHELREGYSGKPLRNKVPLIKERLYKINDEICSVAQEIGNNARMGSTLACLVVSGDRGVIVGKGDSRIYLFRGGELQHLTEDCLEGNRQDKYLGAIPDDGVIETGISIPFKLREGDLFLICSNGLTGVVGDEKIAELMGGIHHSATMANMLVLEALESGGKDNVTAMMIKIESFQQGDGLSYYFNSWVVKAAAVAAIVALGSLLAVASFLLAKNREAERAVLPEKSQEQLDLREPDAELAAPGEDLAGEEETIDGEEENTPEGERFLGAMGVYEIQPGETLYGISLKIYNRNVVEEIKEFNGLDNDVIYAGKIILLPELD